MLERPDKDKLTKGTLVWVTPTVGDAKGTAAVLAREGHLWTVDSHVYARDWDGNITTTTTGWVWCRALGSGRSYDFHYSELALHGDTRCTEEGLTDR